MKNLQEIIVNRRTVKPDRFSDQKVDDSVIEEIIEQANWAPTHGFTEPWRFVVYTGAGKQKLIDFLIQYDSQENGENEIRAKKIAERIEKSSHVLGIGVKRGDNPKIPFIEEELAVAMAVQNIWLSLSDYGLGGYWSTGKVAFSEEFRDFLGLGSSDKSLGLFYIGVPAFEGLPGRRITDGKSKTTWVNK